MFNSFPAFAWGIIDVKVLRLPFYLFYHFPFAFNVMIRRGVAVAWINRLGGFMSFLEVFLICFIIGMVLGIPLSSWLALRSVKRKRDEYFK